MAIYSIKREHIDQRILIQHLIERIVHQNHDIDVALERVDQTFLYSSIENKSDKMLSILAILFMPPTLVSGLFGMNVNVPYETTGSETIPDHISGFFETWWWCIKHTGPFWTITAIALSISVVLIIVFYKTNLI